MICKNFRFINRRLSQGTQTHWFNLMIGLCRELLRILRILSFTFSNALFRRERRYSFITSFSLFAYWWWATSFHLLLSFLLLTLILIINNDFLYGIWKRTFIYILSTDYDLLLRRTFRTINKLSKIIFLDATNHLLIVGIDCLNVHISNRVLEFLYFLFQYEIFLLQ